MRPLVEFSLPLSPNQPPVGFGWEGRDFSELSATTAFNDGIDQRDQFLGRRRCVVCGSNRALQRSHIITQTEPDIWTTLVDRGWIPPQAKGDPTHEPRNGFLLCRSHHRLFDAYDFFIRFLPEIQKFVFINYSDNPDVQRFHGKAIALDIKDHHAPFPSLFIIHEIRVRSFHPFKTDNLALSDDIAWQDWISSDGMYDDDTRSFKRTLPPGNGDDDVTAPPQLQRPPAMTSTGGTGVV